MTNVQEKNEINVIPKSLKARYLLNSNKGVVQFELLGIDVQANKIPNRNVPGEDIVYDAEKHKEYNIFFKPKLEVDDRTKTTYTKGESIWFGPSQAGRVICHLNTREGRTLYEYLSLSNYNGSNPFRDKNKKAIYKLVDDEAAAKLELASQKQVDGARSKVFNAKLVDLRMIADWIGFPSNESETTLRKNLLEEATHRTRTFTEAANMVEGEDGVFLSTVIRSKKHNIIYHNSGTNQWTWRSSNTFFFSYKSDLPETENVIRLARWMQEGEGGSKVYQQMCEALKPFEKEYQV